VFRTPAVWPFVLAALVGCTVQPTPREYIDRHVAPEHAELEARDHIEARIRLLVQSLAAGDPSAARSAAQPAPDAVIVAPGENRIEGAHQVGAIVELVAQRRLPLEIRHIDVRANPRGTVSWFDAILAGPGLEAESLPFSASGVFQLREGIWELSQMHVSAPEALLTEAYPVAAAAPKEGE
jgi:hypothetical protein